MPADPDTTGAQSEGTFRKHLIRTTTRLGEESGIKSVIRSTRDVKLLFLQRFIRMFAYGGTTLVLAAYLSALDIPDSRIGLFMTLTLLGDILIGLTLIFHADKIGRKLILAAGAVLVVCSGLAFALSTNFWVLLAAAVIGVISPNGNEIGPFRAIEESIIAQLTARDDLGSTYAWYTLTGQAGMALGMIVCGWIANQLQTKHGWQFTSSCRVLFVIYACAGAIKLLINLFLTRAVEAHERRSERPTASENEPLLREVADETTAVTTIEQTKPPPLEADRSLRKLVISLTLFFVLDNFGSGVINLTWMTYYFREKFGLQDGALGSIFFTTSIVAALSSLVAASIARRFGNINTMVFTHLPSSILLACIPFPSDLRVALVFLIGRATTQMMDVGPRTAFLAIVLPADKRTAIMGFLNVVKIGSTTVGPLLTGGLAELNLFWVAFVVGGSCKVVYDLGMLFTFTGYEKRTESQHRDQTQ
ncbi:MFS transporter-like protein 127 [Elsinoe australis]|uniref:MFS transporter-like protein 127 n=1 Tax=Elsinoe australis TaxID=40998 RepID=A0A4U7ASF3_9PEZI|nr:MFS transporter-like protein 127 [Elsinoe australis]